MGLSPCFTFFFFNDTATTEIYTLSLHDALPILWVGDKIYFLSDRDGPVSLFSYDMHAKEVKKELENRGLRSEEHTSELQSQSNLVCRLLLEKKKDKPIVRLTVHIRRSRDLAQVN